MDISVVAAAREDDSPVDEALRVGVLAERLGYHEVWAGEGPTWDCFVLAAADAGDQSPASGPVHHTGRPSIAWKEPERRTWAQSGPNASDGASQNACLIGGGYFIHARFRSTDRSPPIWGSRGREFQISPARLEISLTDKGFEEITGAS
jgi:hypothetical protein